MCFYGEILMKQKKESGFTLIEMLIVVAIIAVIVAIAIPTISNSLHKAKTAADMANVRAYYAKLQADYMLTGEYDPSVPSESSYPREITYPDGTVVKLQAGWIAATVVEKNGVKLGYQVAYLCERGDCTLMLGANGSPGG